MAVSSQRMVTWCRAILGDDPGVPKFPLEKYLEGIPRLGSLADLPRGTPVLVRGDVDAKPGAKLGEGDIRLRSMQATLDYGRQRGWKQIVFGHIGREPDKSLSKVRARLAEILGCQIAFIPDWLDPATTTVKDEVAAAVRAAAPGDVIMLENTRKYDVRAGAVEGQAGRSAEAGRPPGPAGRRAGREGGQGLRTRGVFGGQPGRLQRGRARRHGPRGPGPVRSRAVRRAAPRLPGRLAGRVQRAEGRQAGRHAGHDRSRQDPLGDRRRLALGGAEEGGGRARRARSSTWAWRKIRPMRTSPITSPATASSRRRP